MHTPFLSSQSCLYSCWFLLNLYKNNVNRTHCPDIQYIPVTMMSHSVPFQGLCYFPTLITPIVIDNMILFKAAGYTSNQVLSPVLHWPFASLFHLQLIYYDLFSQSQPPSPHPRAAPFVLCWIQSRIMKYLHQSQITCNVTKTRSSVPRSGLILCVHPPHLGDT